ncbi:MAG: ABC transporter ATP-binding protein [Mariprofundaceae bacterium]|nr:ABC transporter ATP-binding protein [Mariprofundaceae bacterium]
MSSDIAIRIKNICKYYQIYDKPQDRLKQTLWRGRKQFYREFKALDDVSFEIKKGETVGIIGRNGSGKSTLLQIICGTLAPTSGTVEVNGRVAALLELGAGFNPEFTGKENVYMNATILGLSKEEIDAKYDEIVAFADIGDFIDQPVKTYSSGMLVRLAFAVAINVEPDILIIDEALAVGDEVFQRKCFSRIEAIKKRGATILFVSHSIQTVVEICDHAMMLDSGYALSSGTPKHVASLYHKFIYGSEEDKEAIRNSESSSYKEEDEAVEIEYDRNSLSQSMIEYGDKSRCVISNIRLENMSGDLVNILYMGRKYRICYHVKFLKGSLSVKWGAMIKTTRGVEVSGLMSHSAWDVEGEKEISSGTKIDIRFDFECLLLPGQYFFNAGVMGDINGENTFLHRIVDAFSFKVDAPQELFTAGLVDLNWARQDSGLENEH